MKKKFFCIALAVATTMTMTSCLDKLFNKTANDAAQVMDDDDDEEDGDDLIADDDSDDSDLGSLAERRRQAQQADMDSEERGRSEQDERTEYPMGDDEVSQLLQKLAGRTHVEVGGMGVIDCIDEVLSTRRLNESDLEGFTSSELAILRNAIYARHGYRFNRDDLFNYFSHFDWYHPVTSDMTAAYNSMSAVERYNIDFIRRHE